MTEKKKKKIDKIVLLAKSKLDRVEVLVSRPYLIYMLVRMNLSQ